MQQRQRPPIGLPPLARPRHPLWNPRGGAIHRFDSKGPYLSIYSAIDERRSRGIHLPSACFSWFIEHDPHFVNYKYERSTDKLDNEGNIKPTFTPEAVTDWFEPGTPRR